MTSFRGSPAIKVQVFARRAPLTDAQLAAFAQIAGFLDALTGKVNRSGDIMTGRLDMGGHRVEGLGAPDTDDDGVSWGFVKALIAAAITALQGNLTLTNRLNAAGNRIEGVGNADTDDDAVNLGLMKGAITQAIANLVNGALGGDQNFAATVLASIAAVLGNAPAALNSVAKVAAAIGNDPNYAANIAATISNLDAALRGGDLLPGLNSLRELAAAVGGDPNFSVTIRGVIQSVLDRLNSLVSESTSASIPTGAVLSVQDAIGQILAVLYSDGIELPGFAINRPGSADGMHFASDDIYSSLSAGKDMARVPGLQFRALPDDGFEVRDNSGRVRMRSSTSDAFAFCLTDDIYILQVIDLSGAMTVAPANKAPAVLANPTPVFGDELFLASGAVAPLSLYPGSVTRDRADSPQVMVSLDAADFAASSAQGTIALDGSRIASSAILTGRATGQRLNRTTRALTVRSRALPIATPMATKILALGDSLTHRKLTERLAAVLPTLGVTPTWIGTLNGLTAAGATNGPLCEGREGWTTADMLGSYGGGSVVTNGVLANGQEAAYSAASYDTKSAYQVFLNPNINAGSQAPVVTIGGAQYRFDLRYYLSRFSLPDPDVVLFNLGMNDSIKLGGAVVTAANFPAILAEIRRALPNAKIVCWGTISAVSTDGDALWLTHAGTLDAICSAVRAARVSDANLHLVSSWAHMSAEVGWPLSTNAATTDANGYVTTVLSDSVHPITAERPAHLAVAVAVANLV